MKKMLFVVAFLTATFSQAQFYVSATGGYAFGVPSTKTGTETANGVTKNTYGTFGEGFNTQLRFGYFFNKTWGVDLGVGYLHGQSQIMSKENSTKNLAGTPLTANVDGLAKAHGRAYGLAISAIYNFTENFYGRFGILTKIGGKTELVGYSITTTNQNIPIAALAGSGISLPSSLTGSLAQLGANGYTNPQINKGAQIETSYTEDFKGKMPFGTIAALGYKYNISKNISVFAEIEYMNISVKRDYSELKNFNQTLTASISDATNTTLPAQPVNATLKTLETFENGVYNDKLRGIDYYSKTTYVDEISQAELNSSPKKSLTEKSSYSSLGFNFGVTYQF